MSCSNSNSDLNNKFYPASKEGMPKVTIVYGPYMNWGRWNHNTTRIACLKEALLEEGYSVQLQHDEKEKGEGWVSVTVEGKEIVRIHDMQHNRHYYDQEEMAMTVLEKLNEEMS